MKNRLRHLTIMVFLQTLAAAFMQRGCFFYTNKFFDFSEADNYWLALGFGVIYIVGAMFSHRLTVRYSEKRLLLLTLVIQTMSAVVAAFWPEMWVVVAVVLVTGLMQGLMWPIYESYISAGYNPAATAKAVGSFNIAWTLGVPVGVMLVGVINDFEQPSYLFVAWGIVQMIVIGMSWPLEVRPLHLPDDHPERASVEQLGLYRALMLSSRASLLSSYAMIYVLSAYLPSHLGNLGLESESAKTAAASLLDWIRFLMCVLMLVNTRWHGRRDLMLLAAVGMPLAFFTIYFGNSLGICLAGEVAFGVLVALAYNAALYYAMVVQNASVDAGGQHEGLIGLGFVVGPAAALAGMTVFTGVLPVLGPFFGVCAIMGVWPLIRRKSLETKSADDGFSRSSTDMSNTRAK